MCIIGNMVLNEYFYFFIVCLGWVFIMVEVMKFDCIMEVLYVVRILVNLD